MAAIYTPNPLAATEIGRGVLVGEFVQRIAQTIADTAQQLAPVDTGAYRDAIHVEPREGNDAAVVAAVPYALFVEFGTEDTPTFAPLRRALDVNASTLG